MNGPLLFVSLDPIDVTQLPDEVRIVQAELAPAALVTLCEAVKPAHQILWRGLSGHPNWHPRDGRFDRASALELEKLNLQLELLRNVGMAASYDHLALRRVSKVEMPAHWEEGGAHPINVHSVKAARSFAIGDAIVICDFKLSDRRNLPLVAPAFHGNPGVRKEIDKDLRLTDRLPVGVTFSLLKLMS